MKKLILPPLTLTALALASICSHVALAAPARPDTAPRPMAPVYKFQQPKALFNVSEDSEDLYDQAFASNWTKRARRSL